LVCTTDEDTDCEQGWVLTINTQPTGAPTQICNLKGTLTFSTQTLLCRDTSDASGLLDCIAAPATNFTLKLGKTDLCDSHTKIVDTAGGMTESLETFYDRDLTLPQTIFQTGDMVYFALKVNNPAATIDTITFNTITVSTADQTLSNPTILYQVQHPGDYPSTAGTVIKTQSQVNISQDVRDSLVHPGQDGLLAFNFRLLRKFIDSLVTLDSSTSDAMQKEIAVEVIIDIWYHGNDNSVKRVFKTNAPLPAVAHAQIAYYLADMDDFSDDNTAVETGVEDYSSFSLSASSSTSVVASGFMFIFAVVVALVL